TLAGEGQEWSPDGTQLAYSAHTHLTEGDIFVTGKQLTVAHNITHGFTNRSSGPVWSPNGTWIAFTGGAEGSFAYVITSDGKEALKGTSGRTPIPVGIPYVTVLDWFPDGAHLLISAPSPQTGVVGLYSVRLDGTGLNELITNAEGGSLSPDGKQIAFVRRPN